ncbi:MAG: PQQ-dependent sugar dehydrogenase [Bacteroidetes bacterium]|nr:PQQ-dependent sugar dehydrogenase [Bacteroidota bacterium]
MKKFLILLALLPSFFIHAQNPVINLTQLQTGFDSPVGVMSCGDNRLFILEQDGRIRIMSKSGVINTTAFLDISGPVQSSGNEQGLLGLAFSPNYKQDGFFYINYIIGNGAGSTRISRFSVNPTDSNLADVNSEVIILEFTQPYTNHNGGNMMFGPDGFLYINQGDGGSGNDPQGNGQNKNTFLGKILRIDVNNQSTYAIPSTNPFVGQANVKEEIWAYGLRNPWRASFDRLTGDMWIGDVGQDAWEEIDFQPASSTGGQNYGWRCREGFHVTPAPANTSGCPSTGFVDPVYEVPQAGGTSCSITGGYVYRGAQHNSLFGRYLFTDYCSGRFWAIRKTGANTFAFDTLQSFTTFQYTSFGQDNLGELYICYRGSTSTNGRIYKISETSDCKPVAFISFDDSLSGCAPVNISALKGEGLAYQWYNSTGLINGANSPEHAPIQSGYYKVLVSKPGSEWLRIYERFYLCDYKRYNCDCSIKQPAGVLHKCSQFRSYQSSVSSRRSNFR